MATEIVAETLTLSSIAKQFSDEEAAWLFLERIKWLNGPACLHCGTIDDAYYLAPEAGTRTTSTGKASYRRLRGCYEPATNAVEWPRQTGE